MNGSGEGRQDGAARGAIALADAVRAGGTSARESVAAALGRAHAAQSSTNAFITILDEQALAAAARIDARLARGEEVGPLAGVPLVVKDNLATAGVRTTAGSGMLADFVPPYDATVVERLVRAGAVVIAKSNLDEFGMGSGNENSTFGPVRNPLDLTRVAGGSSGGSAAAVAAGAAPLALGSDTGGSVRQPAAFCGVIGFKPSYGALSRRGLIAYASSLDQVGIFGRDLADVELSFELAAGVDRLDATSASGARPGGADARSGGAGAPRSGADARSSGADPGDDSAPPALRVGLVRELLTDGFSQAARESVRDAARRFEGLGAEVVELSLPSVVHAPACYYVVATAEASSNLARFGGMLYGGRVGADAAGQEEVMNATRGGLFGTEVKRRLLFGSLALSAGYYDQYYGRALRVRRLIATELEAALAQVDLLLLPAAADEAFPLGEAQAEPFAARFEGASYYSDMTCSLANLAGLPALSMPFGAGASGLPLGVQLMAGVGEDRRLLALARHLA